MLVAKRMGAMWLGAISAAILVSSTLNAHYTVTNLVSDIPGYAKHFDVNLVNPWGLVFDKGNLFVADNGTSLSTSYHPDGKVRDFVITADSDPTGMDINLSDTKFIMTSGNKSAAAKFLFATEEGTILGYSKKVDPDNALIVADRSFVNSVYKGIALNGNYNPPLIYAADFFGGKVDVFDTDFNYVRSFTDPNVPAGFAPFNVALINGYVYVTFAKQLLPDNTDDQAGPGNGFVDVFSQQGTFVKRLISQGALNSPWGLALAPDNFGDFSGALLVGNFGDGLINAYDINSGNFLGTLRDTNNLPIIIDGLWSIKFAPPHQHHKSSSSSSSSSSSDSRDDHALLYFTAGTNDEVNGTLGVIKVAH